MRKKLAIRGHATRGKEVIELLEMMGGYTFNSLMENAHTNRVYYIGSNNAIAWTNIYSDNGCLETEDFFTLEEFLEKYPFKVGDKVIDTADGCPGVVNEMKWDEDVSDMKYYVAFENGVDFGWFTNDSINFFKIEKNENLEETQSKREYDELRMPLEDDDKLATEATIMDKKILPPDGYLVGKITRTDNGILVEYVEKKPKYPTTYEECYDEGNTELHFIYVDKDERDLYESFIQLIRCRNAYWKIAGEEMGLDKPWEPKYEALVDNTFFTIQTFNGEIDKSATSHRNSILAFPTIEMRDIFYKNFKDLIECCKEML